MFDNLTVVTDKMSIFAKEVINLYCQLTLLYIGFQLTAYSYCSMSSNNSSLHSAEVPTLASDEIYFSGFVCTIFRRDIFLFLTNALVSQPLKQWIAGNTEHMASPLL